MSLITAVRDFSRNSNFRVGGKRLSATSSTFINLDNPRVRRDLARHSAIGQLFNTGDTFYQADDGVVTQGGIVTPRAGSLVLDVGAAYYTTAAGVAGTSAVGTVTIGTADATNPRLDYVAINTSSGALVVIPGTATAGANGINRRGLADLPAQRVALAIVRVDATGTAPAKVDDVRP